jgi:hypothetical protein
MANQSLLFHQRLPGARQLPVCQVGLVTLLAFQEIW